MKSLKIKLSLIIALMFVFAASLGCALGVNKASADRTVTISGTSIFYTAGNAEVRAHKVAGATDDEDKFFTMFTFTGKDDAVNYRRNLAYKWFYNSHVEEETEGDEEGEKTPVTLTKASGYFKMEIGFEAVNFEKFVIAFESQQYSQTKDGKSVNYIIFFPAANNQKLNVLITDDKDAELPANPVEIGFDNIVISFSESSNGGCYAVSVESGAKAEGEFVNVGGTYSKYSASSTTPVTPITFEAVFAEKPETPEEPEETDDTDVEDAYVNMVIYELNGQSFVLKGASEKDGYYAGGTVNDITPPVLCLDKGVSHIELGEEISFNYTVIDVLASAPSMTTSYFMLTSEQAKTAEFNPLNYTDDKLYKTVTDSDDQLMTPHVGHYLPQPRVNVNGDGYNSAVYGDDYKVEACVKVCLKLTDTTSTGGQSTYVMLDWYVDDDHLVSVNGNKYIAVANDKEGVSYAYTENGVSDPDSQKWADIKAEYQSEVEKNAKDLKAGSKNYIYLPSAEKLLKDNSTDYSDLTFSIYYNNGSTQSSTGKKANALSINLTKAGKYVFTIIASDAENNKMFYFKDGEKHELDTADIWKIRNEEKGYEDLKNYLPWFEFTVEVSEISIEDPGEQDTAYVGTKYTPKAFEINGVSVSTTYKLYLFNNEAYFKDNNAVLTYEQFMERKEELLKDSKGRSWFTRIYASSEYSKDDEEYEIYNKYEWDNGSSPSFIPQDANSFYLIECTAKASEGGSPVTAYMGIAASPKVSNIKGEDTWVQDNIVPIILFSIAGAALVGIILLLVIKPKNGGDLDEVVAEGKKKSKK